MQQPPRRSFTRLALAIFVPLMVLLAVYYVTDGKLDLVGEPLRLSAESPSDVTLDPDGTTPVAVKLSLKNRTGETQALRAADPCKVLRWAIQAPGDVFVQSKGADCVPEDTATTLASGETIERTETIMLDSKRYQPGVTYTVFVQLWGVETTVDFETAKP